MGKAEYVILNAAPVSNGGNSGAWMAGYWATKAHRCTSEAKAGSSGSPGSTDELLKLRLLKNVMLVQIEMSQIT